ncbi:unnamed protein product [Peronospora destructor]|uniref:Uncharacterized protein n=1 Tax=Peronospora destructor TaxID=86335 RepID=A0AAV0VAK5_9STRA|nr:unnamed protein product [Peronospora destructor]
MIVALRDANLTAFGVQDAYSKGLHSFKAELKEGMPPIERVAVLPLSCAIQTAKSFFQDTTSESPFVCMENYVDFSSIKDEDDMLWTPTHRETDEEVHTRAKAFLLELFQKISEQHAAVVTHSGFMEAVYVVVIGVRMYPAHCEIFSFVLRAI